MNIPIYGAKLKKIGGSYHLTVPAQFITKARIIDPDRRYNFILEVKDSGTAILSRHLMVMSPQEATA